MQAAQVRARTSLPSRPAQHEIGFATPRQSGRRHAFMPVEEALNRQ